MNPEVRNFLIRSLPGKIYLVILKNFVVKFFPLTDGVDCFSARKVASFLLTAGNVEPSAGGGGYPQVAGAGVEDDGELLAGGSDLNLAIVLGLQVNKVIHGIIPSQ